MLRHLLSLAEARSVHSGFSLLAVGLTAALCGCGDSVESPSAPTEAPKQVVTKAADEPQTNQLSAGMQASPLESSNVLRSFVARGLVREIRAQDQTVVIRHEEIPGFMPKMTMPFHVRDKNELRGLAVGAVVDFYVMANQEESWIEGVKIADSNNVQTPSTPDPTSAALLQIGKLKPGEQLPDVELLSESGSTIKLSDFTGSALAFTFIFTRCPLPDFCPRMNQHFDRARSLLMQRTDGPTNWQFLSISFDPEFDKPGVLTRYAYSYRGQNPDRWLFAAAPTHVMSSMVSQLDFRFANEGGSFIHNLRTVVLDPQQRLVRQFDGNRWKAAELADAMAEAARSIQ